MFLRCLPVFDPEMTDELFDGAEMVPGLKRIVVHQKKIRAIPPKNQTLQRKRDQFPKTAKCRLTSGVHLPKISRKNKTVTAGLFTYRREMKVMFAL